MLKRYLPILSWAPGYDQHAAANDLVAALIVTIMLIPQSLGYALLAGLPPQVGLYAAMAPLVLYGLFGTSRVLAVGPVAVVSLMTAAAVGEVAAGGTPEYHAAAIVLALLSGLMLTVMGFLRLGFMANFLSHPVVSGFMSAAGLIIAASQLKHILGIPASGHNLYELLRSLAAGLPETNPATLAIWVPAAAFLFWVRKSLKPLLIAAHLQPRLADLISRAGPLAAVAVTTAFSFALDLDAAGVAIVGTVPQGLPSLAMPDFDAELWSSLVVSALLISVVGFVESVSVGQTLAAKRRQRISPDQELIGLGAANLGAGFTGAYPVTGGFSRSVVNFDAGAETPAAGIFTAGGIALATLTLTPLLYHLPKATLAAIIIVAVLTVVDLGSLRRVYRYSKGDFAAQAATILVTLTQGVEIGIVSGVGLSICIHLYRTSRPNCAVVGQLTGTEHFRSVERQNVVTAPEVMMLRIDESLYFPNARYLEDLVTNAVAADRAIRHLVLMCPAVSVIDTSALESIEALNLRLADSGVKLHLSEVRDMAMDRLRRGHFLEELTGQVFLTQYDAFHTLAPELAERTLKAERVEPAESVG